jgi:hypothetical protein
VLSVVVLLGTVLDTLAGSDSVAPATGGDEVPNFEVFTKRMVPMTRQPFVTIQKRGTISINKAAQAALGEPEAVELLYDAAEKIVGLRPVEATAQHAYPLRSQSGKEVGPFIIAGTAFTKYYGIDTTVSRRWVAQMTEGILMVDMKEPGTPVTSNRTAGRKQADNVTK